MESYDNKIIAINANVSPNCFTMLNFSLHLWTLKMPKGGTHCA